MSGKTDAFGRERGVALVTVLAVFAALLLIATPFALSMRAHYDTSVNRAESSRAVRDAESAIEYAKASLMRTCGELDATPDHDTLDELVVDLSRLAGPLGGSVRDPRARLWSVRVEDEQGRINVNSASPFLLGNLLGVSRLAAEIDEKETRIVVEDAGRFAEEGGVVWIEGEFVRYARATGATLVDCERGVAGGTEPRSHSLGAAAVDARAIRVAEARYALRHGTYAPFPNVEAMKAISDLGEARFRPGELERIAPLLTVWSARPDDGAFWNPQEVRAASADERGRTVLEVSNGRYVSPGSLVRLDVRGEEPRYAIVSSTSFKPGAELIGDAVLGRALELSSSSAAGGPIQFTGSSGPGGVVKLAIGSGDDLGRPDRVTLGADLGVEIERDSLVEAVLWTEARHPVNVNTASEEVLVALLEGLRLSGREDAVTRAEALAVAKRIRSAPVTSHRHLLVEVLEKAEEEGEVSDDDVAAIYLNALNSNDASLSFSTAPFCFVSFDVFRIEATAMRNSAAGAELARTTVREIVRLSPPGERTLRFETQGDFEDPINWSRTGRFIATGPVNVAGDDGKNVPASRFRMHRFRHLFPSLARLDENGLDAGDFRLAPARSPGFNVEHFDDHDDPDGYDAADGPFRHWGVSSLGGESGQFNIVLSVTQPAANGAGQTVIARAVTVDRVGGAAGGGSGFVSPAAVSLWFRPEGGGGAEWTLFDIGETSERNRVSLVYEPGPQHLRFRVQDAALEDPRERLPHETEVVYPLRLVDRSWYHVTAAFRGTKPQDLTLFVDGNPAPMRHRLLTRLSSSLDSGAVQGTIAVEDSEGFPDEGVLRIGDEKIEYSSRTSGSFSIRSDALVASGRGARGSQLQSHEAGVAVELFGYSLAIESDIPTGGASLGGGGTLGEFRIAALDGRTRLPYTDDKGRPLLGILATDVEIPLKALPGDDAGNGSDFMDAFQSSGYALVVSGYEAIDYVCTDTGRVMGSIIGYREIVYYGGVAGNRLVSVQRGQTTRLNDARDALFTTKAVFANETPAGEPSERRPTYVVPISLLAAGDVSNGYLDPAETGVSERVQVDDEWVRYDSILEGRYFVRDDPSALGAVGRGRKRVQIPIAWNTGGGGGGRRGGPGAPPADFGADLLVSGPRGLFIAPIAESAPEGGTPGTGPEGGPAGQRPGTGRRPGPEGPTGEKPPTGRRPPGPPGGTGGGTEGGSGGGTTPGGGGGEGGDGGSSPRPTTTQVDSELKFRHRDGTAWETHAAGADLVPVFRTMGLAAGRFDSATILAPGGGSGELARVNWSARGDGRFSGGRGRVHNYVAFEADVSRRQASTIGDMRADGMTDAELDRYDSRHLARIVKFPSGELAARPPREALFGGSSQGGGAFPGHLDEIGIERSRNNAYVVSELDRDQSDTRPRFVTAEEDEISVARADLQIDWGVREGRRRVDGRRYVSGRYFGRRVALTDEADAVPYTPLPPDGGLVLVDRELIAYSELEERDEAERRLVVLKGCVRGFLGTEPSVHSLTTPVTFLDFLPVSRLESALTAGGAIIDLAEAGDFPLAGAVAIVGPDGRIAEIVHNTRRDGRRLFMPETTDAEGARMGGLFRGRFGTRPRAFSAGDFAIRYPFRYWDRWKDRSDHPEMAVLDVGACLPGAFVTGVSWDEEPSPSSRTDVRVLVRLDGRASFGDEPRGAGNGLYRFDDPSPGGLPNPIGASADTVEIRAGFAYEADAFDGRFISNAWKETPSVRSITLRYLSPSAVLYREEE